MTMTVGAVADLGEEGPSMSKVYEESMRCETKSGAI